MSNITTITEGQASHSVLVQQAFTAIDSAATVDEVKKVLENWAGIAAYASKAKDKQLQADAAEIRMRAERRLGEMMQAQKETVGLNQGGRPQTGVSETPVSEKPATLAEAGIDKNLAKNARKEAAKSSEQFEEDVAEKKSGILEGKGKRKAVLNLEAGEKVIARHDADAAIEQRKAEYAAEPSTTVANPIIAAWNTATKDQQREFWNFIKKLDKSVLLLEQLHRITAADEVLDLAKVGAFIERLGKEMFFEALAWAPKLKVEIERRGRSGAPVPHKGMTNDLRKGLGTRSPAAHELAIAKISGELERKGLTRDDIVIACRKSPTIPEQPTAESTSRLIKANGASAEVAAS
jgi:hypothetical protein